jgi:hypothetical protein
METVTVPVEHFTEEERARLAPHFTNLDRPVFGLVNLPETVKGAMFARYSRYAGTLRRMFLDEFADSVPEVPAIEGVEGERASQLYERIFIGFGDTLVAQPAARISRASDVEPPHEDPPAPRLAAYSSSRRAHRIRRRGVFGYRYYRDARSPGVRARDGRAVRDVRAPARRRDGVDGGTFPLTAASRLPRIAARSREGVDRARLLLRRRFARRHLRQRPDVRAARVAPARAPARGARAYGDDAGGAAAHHPELVARVPRE